LKKASKAGTPLVRPLFFDFPEEQYLSVDEQFLLGPSILVSPVLTPGAKAVSAYLPGRDTIWREWSTRAVAESHLPDRTVLPAPLEHLPLHIRGGSALLLHAEARYTTTQTRESGYHLLVALDKGSEADGEAYVDDGHSMDASERHLLFSVRPHAFVRRGMTLDLRSAGSYHIHQSLHSVEVLGVQRAPAHVRGVASWAYEAEVERLVLAFSPETSLNVNSTIEWW
jgi:alpha-glucosidase